MKSLFFSGWMVYSIFSTAQTMAPQQLPLPAMAPGHYVQSPATVSFTSIGSTRFDLQTNQGTVNRILQFDDGTVEATWTMGFLETAFDDRGTGYNYHNGTNWAPAPTARIETVRTGWPSIFALGSNGEGVIAHQATGGLIFSHRSDKTTGAWTQNTLSLPVGVTSMLWPRVVSNGADNNCIHVFSETAPVANSGAIYQGLDGALVYSRSQDGGTTWDIQNLILPGMTSTEYRGFAGDSYALAKPAGNTLAFVYGDEWADIFLMKSYDNGTTWSKTTIFQHPYPLFQETTTLVTDTPWVCDGNIAVALDNYGVAHVCFGLMRVQNLSLTDASTSFFSYTDGLVYWNESMSSFTSLDKTVLAGTGNLIGWCEDINNNGLLDFTAVPIYYNSLSSMPTIAIGTNNDIYVVFASQRENLNNGIQNYHQLIGRKSSTYGLTWGDMVDLNESIIYNYSECVFPVMTFGNDNFLHLIFQKDDEPGMAVRGDSDPYADNDIMYGKIPLSTFNAGVTVCPGNFNVPVIVQTALDISSFSISFSYDPAVLTYQGYTAPDPVFGGNLLVFPENNTVNLSWSGLTPISLVYDTLVYLDFMSVIGWCNLQWNNSIPGVCHFTDINSLPLPASYVHGSVVSFACSDVQGLVSYNNQEARPLPEVGVTLSDNGQPVGQTYTNTDGAYFFHQLAGTANYTLLSQTNLPYSGANAGDALMVMKHFVGMTTLTGLPAKAGDVDGSNTLNTVDALLILKRFVGLENSYPAGDWVFETPGFSVSPGSSITQNIKALCYGDVDGSYYFGAKESLPQLRMTQDQWVHPDQPFDLPVSFAQTATISSLSWVLSIPEGMMENGLTIL
ncbi:MAG: hypothetical protein NTU44_10410 [Bacteroidetes bacterium]|nr:hypothetical protein [Bacteroidota bacterium]